MEDVKKLTDLEITISLRSSEADINFLTSLAKVILTSLQKETELNIAFIETEAKVKSGQDKKLTSFSGKITIF